MAGINLTDERNRRLASWLQGVPAPPLRVSIFPTNVCNLECKMCGVPNGVREGRFRVKDEFTIEEWRRLVKEGAQMGILEWWVGGGGEPLVRRELTTEIIKTIRKYSPYSEIELTTNASRFTEEIIRDLVVADLDKMQFSIDFPDAKMHNWLRGGDATFEKATWAIRRFSEFKRELGKKVPWLTANVILNARNYTRLEEFIPFAKNIGIEQVNVTPLRVTDEMRPVMQEAGLVMDACQKREVFAYAARASRLAQKEGVGFGFLVNREWEDISETGMMTRKSEGGRVGPQDPSKRENLRHYLGLRCYESWYTLAVDALGNPGPCVTGAIGNPQYSFREHTLKEVWYGEYFLKIRSRLNENLLIDPCSQCTVTDMREKVGLLLNEHVRAT